MPGDPSLLLDDQSGEVLYPRDVAWATTGVTRVELDQDPGNCGKNRYGGMRTTAGARLVWRRQDISLRRAPSIPDGGMKWRTGQTLSRAAGTAPENHLLVPEI